MRTHPRTSYAMLPSALTTSALLLATVLAARAGSVTGVILDDLREPVPEVQVLLEQIGGESGPWSTVTGPDGRFSASDPLLFGNIRVTPTKPGIQFTPAVRDLFFDFTGTADFAIDVKLFPVVGWSGWFNFIERTADVGSAANRHRSVLFGPGPSDETFVSDSGDGFGQRAFASGWRDGSGTRSWRFSFSSLHRSRLKFSCRLMGTDNFVSFAGPRDFQLQYSLDGIGWTNVAGGAMRAGRGNGNFNSFSRIILPPVLDNQPSVQLRLLMTSNTAVTGGIVTDGQSHIDDILVEGVIVDAPLRISARGNQVIVTADAGTAPSLEYSTDLRVWKPVGPLDETQPGEYELRESARVDPILFVRVRP
jgi:hypothetical protein